MILSSKQKWVVDRLKRQGWKTCEHFMTYSTEQCLLWLPLKEYDQFDWSGIPFFYMDNRKGCWFHFRPRQNEALHLKYHVPWLTVKNWDKYTKPFIQTCRILNDNRDVMNFDTFSERSSVCGTDVAVSGLHLVS